MTVWAMFITAILQAFALPVLTSALVMQLLDRTAGTNFFSPPNWSIANGPPVVGGGQPLLWQHLFWFYSHPGRLHHDLAGDGDRLGCDLDVFSQAAVWLQTDGLRDRSSIAVLGLHGLGPPYVPVGHEPRAGGDLHAVDDADRAPFGDQGLQLAGDDLGRTNSVYLGHAERARPLCRCSSSVVFQESSWRPLPVDMYIHDTYFIVAHIYITSCSAAACSASSRPSTSGFPRCSAG